MQTWVIHHLQIIGEAARKLSPETRGRAPDVPWPEIIAIRNILVHDYFGVDLEVVWSTVESSLPVLKQRVIDLRGHPR